MAEIQYGEVGAGTPAFERANLKWMVNWLGGLISVTLIAGLVFWGYQLVIRDVAGIPVVRSLEGPMRITPVDPGGLSVENQGLAVNNIAAVGEAEAPAGRLVLAPKPTVLNSNDPTAAVLDGIVTSQDTPEQAAGSPVAQELQAATETTTVPDQATLIEATLRLVEEDSASASVEHVPHSDAVVASVAGMTRSLLPIVRPKMEGVTVAATPTGSVNSIAPADIPAGTRLAQLGAFESEAMAKDEWLKISARFDVFMADKSRVIEAAQSGGKEFYRLRVHGFSDLADARRFCSTLLAGQANCIPVVTR